MFDLEKESVHAIVSKMIINEELMASLDEPSQCMVMHRTEPSRLQSLSLQLADKISQLVENNERLLELRPGQFINCITWDIESGFSQLFSSRYSVSYISMLQVGRTNGKAGTGTIDKETIAKEAKEVEATLEGETTVVGVILEGGTTAVAEETSEATGKVVATIVMAKRETGEDMKVVVIAVEVVEGITDMRVIVEATVLITTEINKMTGPMGTGSKNEDTTHISATGQITFFPIHKVEYRTACILLVGGVL